MDIRNPWEMKIFVEFTALIISGVTQWTPLWEALRKALSRGGLKPNSWWPTESSNINMHPKLIGKILLHPFERHLISVDRYKISLSAFFSMEIHKVSSICFHRLSIINMANSWILVGSSSDLPANKSSKAPGDVRSGKPIPRFWRNCHLMASEETKIYL